MRDYEQQIAEQVRQTLDRVHWDVCHFEIGSVVSVGDKRHQRQEEITRRMLELIAARFASR